MNLSNLLITATKLVLKREFRYEKKICKLARIGNDIAYVRLIFIKLFLRKKFKFMCHMLSNTGQLLRLTNTHAAQCPYLHAILFLFSFRLRTALLHCPCRCSFETNRIILMLCVFEHSNLITSTQNQQQIKLFEIGFDYYFYRMTHFETSCLQLLYRKFLHLLNIL